MKKEERKETRNYHVEGKSMTRKEFWNSLFAQGRVKELQKLPKKSQREFTGKYGLYKTKAGYVYAVVGNMPVAKKKRYNSKVGRLLNALAIVVKDEDFNLINAIHKIVVDPKDGYDYYFASMALSARVTVKGKSY